jgi:hypothetical protein
MVSKRPEPLHAFIRARFSPRSWILLGIMLGVAVAASFTVGLGFPFLIDPTGRIDWLLLGVWAFMALTICWDVQPRRDLKLIAVGLAGGTVIEWWGTHSELWRYYTHERPPLWILPSWPIAAVSVSRIVTLYDRVVPRLRLLGPAYWLVMPAFVILMTRFSWPSATDPASCAVIAIMVAVTLIRPVPDRDLVIFVAGISLGVFLEYWGTSRRCWIYYTQEVPPPEAVLAHGFVAVAFVRGAQLLDAVVRPK